MPQPTRNWYFEPWPVGDGGGGDAADPRLTCLPLALLQRHGARLLDPSTAPVIPPAPGAPESWSRAPQSTVYRARTLLVPADLLAEPGAVDAINAALALVGMKIVVPDVDRQLRSTGRAAQVLRSVPRVVALAPAPPPPGQPTLPVTVDAWTALQALRAAASAPEEGGTGKDRDVADHSVRLPMDFVRRIALEHLLVGSPVMPGSSDGESPISGSPSSEGHALSGPGNSDSYVYGGGDTRTPVTLLLPAPVRTARAAGDPRRPVVAVLDTGVRSHSWLDVQKVTGGYATNPPDGFVQIDPVIQNAVDVGSAAAAAAGDEPRVPIKGPWDVPVYDHPLIGELADASGHGTFISGIVRQVAPDAQVLSIRIMHSDDIVYESDLINGLTLLADRIAVAQAGDMAGMVDVVSLSLGYFEEAPADVAYSSGLWLLIEQFLEMGVAVAAAAGNFATHRKLYPAAFTLETAPGPVPVISVGALNPNGTRALFSNGGRWVWAWAMGAAVVSTFPDDINASRTPEVREHHHQHRREALDPDDYHGGFAVWSGTSFSTPLIAAQLAAQLLANAAADAALGLDQPGAQAATGRMSAALTALGAHPEPDPGAGPAPQPTAAPAPDGGADPATHEQR